MTREGMIEIAALRICPDDQAARLVFMAGAMFADSHPINVWHDANTMPSDSKSIIYLTKNGKFGVISQVHSNKWDWYVAVKYSIIKWAYIADILPKENKE